MILHRLSQHIRRQDWFAVLIEFIVVVAGIFVGLQANDWAQERQDRQQERAALVRLLQEAENAYRYLDGYVSRSQRLNQLRRNAVQFVDSDSEIPEDELALKIGINTLGMFPPISPVSVVYDELKSAGQMQLIQSAALRDQLAEFHISFADYEKLRYGFSDNSNRFQEVYRKHVIWDYNPEATSSDILLSTYNWESLRDDEVFLFEVIGLLRNQLVAEEWLVGLRDQAKTLCESLGETIGRPCTAS